MASASAIAALKTSIDTRLHQMQNQSCWFRIFKRRWCAHVLHRDLHRLKVQVVNHSDDINADMCFIRTRRQRLERLLTNGGPATVHIIDRERPRFGEKLPNEISTVQMQ